MTETTHVGAAAPAGSQVAVTDRLHPAVSASRPFVIDSDTDITGTATGNDNVESYCALDSTAASRYRLNRPDHNQIFHFDSTVRGVTQPAYCLDKFKDGPYGDVPYENAPFETLFPTASARQKNMLAWLLANAYPMIGASETFALAGVDPNESPALDDNDAYAAVQVALWVLLGQIAPSEVVFLDCGADTAHPKSARLRAAVLQLLQLAGAFADAAPTQDTWDTASCRCGSPLIQCCPAHTPPASANTPRLSFRGCPTEVRTLCGRLLVGPFQLRANLAGTPVITIEPFCACGSDLSASFSDFCGNPISAPGLGQEFYLVLRSCGGCLCFDINASLSGQVTRVLTMGPTSTALDYQPIGTALEDYDVTLTTSLCVCVTVPAETSPAVPGMSCSSSVFVQNNNNNNNNNSNQSSHHSEGFGGCPPIVFPPYWMPGWYCPPFPPYPPEPPYPPHPPYPPEPPYPPYPPYPPEPPYPPYPPYPPKPPYPPEPPHPPIPPQPPCPPCPCCPERPELPPCPGAPDCCICEPCPCPPMPPCPCGPACPCQPPCKPEPVPCYLPLERRQKVCRPCCDPKPLAGCTVGGHPASAALR